MKNAALVTLALVGLAAAVPAQAHFEGVFGCRFEVAGQIGEAGRPQARLGWRCPPPLRPEHGAPAHSGAWRVVTEEVHVPGYYRDEYVPPRYGWISDHCGRRRWGVVECGRTRLVWVPPHCETRSRKVWVARC